MFISRYIKKKKKKWRKSMTVAAEQKRRTRKSCLLVISILQRQANDDFPERTRDKITVLVGDFLRLRDEIDNEEEQRLKMMAIVERLDDFRSPTIRKKLHALVQDFLTKVQNDIYDMITTNSSHYYRVLDSHHDREAEIENAIRLFPENLSRKGTDGRTFPMTVLTIEGVSLFTLLLRLGNEFSHCKDEDDDDDDEDDDVPDVPCRVQDNEGAPLGFANVLRNLVQYSNDSMDDNNNNNRDENYYQLLDCQILAELLQLRRMDLLQQEDIQSYRLVYFLCTRSVILEKVFRFFVEWDPTVLLTTQVHEVFGSPLTNVAAAVYDGGVPPKKLIRGFQIVFDYLIYYLPKQKGILRLFQKQNDLGLMTTTPLQLACTRSSCELEEEEEEKRGMHQVAIMTFVTKTLLRQNPDILQKLLSPQMPSSSSSLSSTPSSSSLSHHLRRHRSRFVSHCSYE